MRASLDLNPYQPSRTLPAAANIEEAKWADEPGSVVDGHLSCLHVTVQLFARYPDAVRATP